MPRAVVRIGVLGVHESGRHCGPRLAVVTDAAHVEYPGPLGGGITELAARLLDEGAHELRAAVAAPAPDPLEQRFVRVSRLLARAFPTMHVSLAISR